MFRTYQCHKQVQAAKIVNIQSFGITSMGSGQVVLHLEGGGFVTKDVDWFKKHQPSCGGYLVRHVDGYTSFSPAKAFEEGYALLADLMKPEVA